MVLIPDNEKLVSESRPIKTSEVKVQVHIYNVCSLIKYLIQISQTLADVLCRIREDRLVEDTYVIEVRRDSVLYDSLKSVKRAGFSSAKTIKVRLVKY